MGHTCKVALTGFGEAAQTFVTSDGWSADTYAFDIKTNDDNSRQEKIAEYKASGVTGYDTLEEAISKTPFILSLVTADQTLGAAKSAASYLKPNTLYCDMNSVAPETKRAAAQIIEAAGGRYVDVAILAPVMPARLDVALLLSGPATEQASKALRDIGFKNVRDVGPDIGMASAIKMVRSIMVKGMEALTTECILAAEAAGVREEVVASLNKSWPETDWAARADYNMERMMLHGLRRAAEMEEVVKMLASLGTDSNMTAATIHWQKSIGSRGLAPFKNLTEKIRQIFTPEGKQHDY